MLDGSWFICLMPYSFFHRRRQKHTSLSQNTKVRSTELDLEPSVIATGKPQQPGSIVLYYARCSVDYSIVQNNASLMYLALAPLRRLTILCFMNNLFRGVVNDSLDRTTNIVVTFVCTEPGYEHDSFLAFSIGSIKQNQNCSLNSC